MSLIVEYEINEGRAQDFAALMRDHARRTLFEEAGCMRFEVLQPVDEGGNPLPDRLIVSEVYADEAAVAAHRANPRMDGLRTSLAPMLKSRRLIRSVIIDDRPEETGLTPDQLNASNDG
ncbi:MAG: antibiotic biosynthesis monooxygenase [Rhizobiaceae bacterium]|nr:antibiotic biosynthesis monooxygenase [Rhizobiaceae bacterium]